MVRLFFLPLNRVREIRQIGSPSRANRTGGRGAGHPESERSKTKEFGHLASLRDHLANHPAASFDHLPVAAPRSPERPGSGAGGASLAPTRIGRLRSFLREPRSNSRSVRAWRSAKTTLQCCFTRPFARCIYVWLSLCVANLATRLAVIGRRSF